MVEDALVRDLIGDVGQDLDRTSVAFAHEQVHRVLRQLGHEPTVPTRNRKPLEANPLAPWELRIGEYRVYFDVKEEPERVVRIVAVGLKDRDRVLVGGIEVQLR